MAASTRAVTFDLFGTLVRVERPADPARAVADALAERDVTVPEGFERAYREPQVDAPDYAEVPLPAHVATALGALGVDAPPLVVRRATVAALSPDPAAVHTLAGAPEAVAAAADRGPVGVLSDCSVPGLARQVLTASDVDRDHLDAVTTSAGCGWRKPHRGAFEAAARQLDCPPESLVHVGDDPDADGGAATLGATFVDVADTPLADLPAHLEGLG
ncbi:MAG: HAD family hydrolase [Haloarculaceae archaeon]